MSDHIRERINRKLDALTEERLYQILDYVEFLESKYAARQSAAPNAFTKFAEGVEDRLRAGRVSASTIADTMGLLNRAVGMLNGVAAAGKSVAADLANAAQRVGTAVADATAQAGTVITSTTPPPADPSAPNAPSAAPNAAPPSTHPSPPAPPPAGPAAGPAPGEPRS
ncbi:hypothetical protein J421_3920 [Gemmatirosa kalamazoonensis]|uniref:DUF2281 domain-containing protein n=1 Tax=Gemmatirosa kalamazoonensis TaxID=861299 RepID=W0RLX4_9BACT|nr:hypothetical protein [Gemmatirosa kalamazoonensis]AHG91457.1 hypothetical protein J421_3920 [Gemmatirosa kalamazoonensis]